MKVAMTVADRGVTAKVSIKMPEGTPEGDALRTLLEAFNLTVEQLNGVME